MLGVKVSLEHAQKVKRYLLEHDIFNREYIISRTPDAIVFPIMREFSPPFDFDVDFVDVDLNAKQQTQTLKEELWPLLSKEEKENLVTAYDVVGSISIIEIPDLFSEKEKLIGEKILALNKNVRTVLKKDGAREGIHRTQKLSYVAGDDTRETLVVENGIKLRVNVEAAYYSIRMATERKRILEQIKPGERILCMFSGVGPYPIVFSKHSQADEIVGIEINSLAHELAVENSAMNRCTNVRLLCGDASEVLSKLGGKFDRITMPLPQNAYEFLNDALSVSKEGTIIHFYSFQDKDEFEKAVSIVKLAMEKNGKNLGQYSVVKVGQHAPRIWRICVDAEVSI